MKELSAQLIKSVSIGDWFYLHVPGYNGAPVEGSSSEWAECADYLVSESNFGRKRLAVEFDHKTGSMVFSSPRNNHGKSDLLSIPIKFNFELSAHINSVISAYGFLSKNENQDQNLLLLKRIQELESTIKENNLDRANKDNFRYKPAEYLPLVPANLVGIVFEINDSPDGQILKSSLIKSGWARDSITFLVRSRVINYFVDGYLGLTAAGRAWVALNEHKRENRENTM